VFLLVISGCESTIQQGDVVLSSPNRTEVAKEALISFHVPSGMSVTRHISIRSRLEQTISDIRVKASCGCTLAELSQDFLEPGDFANLICTIDGTTSPQKRNVSVRLFSADLKDYAFDIGLTFESGKEFSDYGIDVEPTAFIINEGWDEKNSYSASVKLSRGKKVPFGGLSCSSDSPGTKTTILKDSILLEITKPTLGRIDGNVEVSYSLGKDCYKRKIPVICLLRSGGDSSEN